MINFKLLSLCLLTLQALSKLNIVQGNLRVSQKSRALFQHVPRISECLTSTAIRQ